MAAWPPNLDDLVTEIGFDEDDGPVPEDKLSSVLDAAIAWVARVKAGWYRFTDDEGSEDLPVPTDDILLGTLRLAVRWHTRSRSPDGMVSMGDLGSARVTSFDPDIDQLLQIGRHTPPFVV